MEDCGWVMEGMVVSTGQRVHTANTGPASHPKTAAPSANQGDRRACSVHVYGAGYGRNESKP